MVPFDRLLALADDALILGHRLSEWTGHAPLLEEELALGNIALDLIGTGRRLYQYAGEIEGTGRDEDGLAYLRDAPQYKNLLLVEQPNGDFAMTVTRHFLYAAYATPYWQNETTSADPTFADIAKEAARQSAYHLRHFGEWLVRLGDGTEESRRRTQAALDALWMYTGEMFDGLPQAVRTAWDETVDRTLARAALARPQAGYMQSGGRRGRHSEHLGYVLAEMQFLQRAYPGATW
ncbi:MAG TPA: 1,2-phenylacetyl-CoA epoxidase subunit PaaC [Stellaceae bacterium]|jgi:ring-1,2-phenylacetyl-CoA epoxidase subunit PaaC